MSNKIQIEKIVAMVINFKIKQYNNTKYKHNILFFLCYCKLIFAF